MINGQGTSPPPKSNTSSSTLSSLGGLLCNRRHGVSILVLGWFVYTTFVQPQTNEVMRGARRYMGYKDDTPSDDNKGPLTYEHWVQEHCWRDRTVDDRARYNLLVTGAGYSATGYFSKAFTAAGYPVGHERLQPRMVGLSDWIMSTRAGNRFSPFLFAHIFLLVRHPLKVLRSEYGTEWNFTYKDGLGIKTDVAKQEVMFRNRTAFYGLQLEFKTLEWWTIYTMLGENLAECYIRAEDISADMLLYMCLRSDLPKCESKPWYRIAHSNTHYNSHTKPKPKKNPNIGRVIPGTVPSTRGFQRGGGEKRLFTRRQEPIDRANAKLLEERLRARREAAKFPVRGSSSAKKMTTIGQQQTKKVKGARRRLLQDDEKPKERETNYNSHAITKPKAKKTTAVVRKGSNVNTANIRQAKGAEEKKEEEDDEWNSEEGDKGNSEKTEVFKTWDEPEFMEKIEARVEEQEFQLEKKKDDKKKDDKWNSEKLTKLRTWEELESMVQSKEERAVLDHARRVCRKYYSEKEC